MISQGLNIRSLRGRTLFILVLSVVGIMVVMSRVVSDFLSESFSTLENESLVQDAKRSVLAFEDELKRLKHQAEDWSFWDDAYDFLLSSDPEFISANLIPAQLETIDVMDTIFFKADGTLHFGVSRRSGTVTSDEDKRVLELKRGALNLLSTATKQRCGLLVIEDELMLAVASPVTNSSKNLPPIGTMVFTRTLNAHRLKSLAMLTRLELHGESFQKVAHLPYIADPSPSEQRGEEPIVEIRSEYEARASSVIKSLLGHPILRLTVIADRPIAALASRVRSTMLLVFLLSGTFIIALTMFLLHRLVLSRVGRLSDEVNKIGLSSSSLRRVTSNGEDELSLLADNINFMLSFIESHHTALAQARDEAEWANATKGQFVANISHELRTPLHTIIGMVRILLKEERSPCRREYLGNVYDAASSLLSLINDVLDFSKTEAHKLELEVRPFSIREVVREALRAVSLKGYEAGLEFLCTVERSVPDIVHGDGKRLGQVLVNLLGNAVKFTRSGEIRIAVKGISDSEEGYVLRFSVEDTGIGIPQNRIHDIFSSFTQADNTISRRFQGTGLGLTISRELVRLMGGDITVQSRVGEGSVFSFTITTRRGEELVPTRESKERVVDYALLTKSDRFGSAFAAIVDETQSLHSINPPLDSLTHFDVVIIDSACASDVSALEMAALKKVVVLFSPLEFSLRQSWESYPSVKMMLKPVIFEDLLTLQPEESVVVEKSYEEMEGASLKVLLADDTRTNRLILEEMLEEFGHRVTSVENGSELIQALEREVFDVILTDVQMPVMDGLTATRVIRERELQSGSRTIPIIAVTAHAMLDERQQILASGVTAIATKPINPDQLRQLLAESLAH